MADTGPGESDEATRPPDAIVLTGATATGKTELSLALARRLDGEIISMDSRQVYRGMDIGTAKAGPEARRDVPHHGLDLIHPDERYNAARFARDARRWIAGIRGRGRTPILVGGTGFFLRALTRPLFREPEMDPGRRRALESCLTSLPPDRLREWVRTLDSAWAGRMETLDRQRVLRAIEVALLSGRPLSWWQREAEAGTPPLRPAVFVMQLPRDILYRRIDERARAMVRSGLVQEVRGLLDAGYGTASPGLSATGYREIVDHIRGGASLEAAVDAIQRATRRYARRQLSWFRNQLPAGAVRLDAGQTHEELIRKVVEQWEEALH